MTSIVNADCGQVLGIVDGRESAAVGGWLAPSSQVWRNRIHVVAMAFKRAIATQLPNAVISVDPFHLVQLAKLILTRVRQRLVREREQRRGRKIDPAWAHRTLLLRGYNTLSKKAGTGRRGCSTATLPLPGPSPVLLHLRDEPILRVDHDAFLWCGASSAHRK
jgi:transposase